MFAESRSGLRLDVGSVVLMLMVTVFAVAVVRIYLRVESTMLGYEIGRLKEEETKVREERGLLQMRLARLTTRKSLTALSRTSEMKDGGATVVDSNNGTRREEAID